MTDHVTELGRDLLRTVVQPSQIAPGVMRLPLTAGHWALAMVLSGVISAMLVTILTGLAPPPQPGLADPDAAGLMLEFSPLVLAILFVATQFVFASALHLTGRAMGGSGDLRTAFAAMAWSQGALIVLEAAQVPLALLLPPLAAIVSILTIPLGIWITSALVAAQHGFDSTWRGAQCLFLAALGLVLILTVLITLSGAA
ncbi:MAG: YIP1 family protein [Paracoccaceae bacterium]